MTCDQAIAFAERFLVAVGAVVVLAFGGAAVLAWFVGPRRER